MKSPSQTLRNGVKKIISRFSPISYPEQCHSYKPSRHPRCEFVFALEGSSRYMFNNSVYDFEVGTAFLIDSWITHASGYTKQDNNLLHLWGNLDGEHMSACILRISLSGQYELDSNARLIEFSSELARIFTIRWNRLFAIKNATDEIVMQYMRAPLNMILDETAFQAYENFPSDKGPRDISEILRTYIRIRNGYGCSLEHLEQISGYSRYHLAHRFQEQMGITIGDYINQVRIEYTRSAFKRGLKQKEIAFGLGFSSPSTFWNWLQKHKDLLCEKIHHES